MKLTRKAILFSAAILLGAAVVGGSLMLYASGSPKDEESQVTPRTDAVEVVHRQFGLPVDSFTEIAGKIKRNQYLGEILRAYHTGPQQIARLASKAKHVFDIRNIRSGRPYTLFCSKGSLQKAAYFVYQPDPIDYVVFDLRDSVRVYKGKMTVTTKEKEASGIIENSLFEALDKAQADPELAVQLANIYAWDIDFYSIQPGDRFKVVYDEQYIGGKRIGLGRIKAAEFKHAGETFYAFYFKDDSTHTAGYYDQHAHSLHKAFLKAPLKFYHITSRYSMHRYHPIEHRWKPHLGTDFAAPTGTPIMSTAAGVVVASRYSRFNGNYVKVRHNSEYTTQYLHMSRRAVKVGQYVKQGQVIGYVGSTGEATGPHVCYRFWKNGRQVDPFKQKFPPASPVAKTDMRRFTALMHSEKSLLAGITYDSTVTLVAVRN